MNTPHWPNQTLKEIISFLLRQHPGGVRVAAVSAMVGMTPQAVSAILHKDDTSLLWAENLAHKYGHTLLLEYTLPDVSQSVIITRLEGRTGVPEKESLKSLARHNATLVLFLSSGMCEKVQSELLEAGIRPETPAAIVYKATWPDEKRIFCTVATLAQSAKANEISKTALIIVGNVVSHTNYSRSKLYDPCFTTEFRQAQQK